MQYGRGNVVIRLMQSYYNSILPDNAVAQLSKLPGIGRKTALRLALHLLRQEQSTALDLGESIIQLRKNICYCSKCHNISEQPICEICANPRRDA